MKFKIQLPKSIWTRKNTSELKSSKLSIIDSNSDGESIKSFPGGFDGLNESNSLNSQSKNQMSSKDLITDNQKQTSRDIKITPPILSFSSKFPYDAIMELKRISQGSSGHNTLTDSRVNSTGSADNSIMNNKYCICDSCSQQIFCENNPGLHDDLQKLITITENTPIDSETRINIIGMVRRIKRQAPDANPNSYLMYMLKTLEDQLNRERKMNTQRLEQVDNKRLSMFAKKEIPEILDRLQGVSLGKDGKSPHFTLKTTPDKKYRIVSRESATEKKPRAAKYLCLETTLIDEIPNHVASSKGTPTNNLETPQYVRTPQDKLNEKLIKDIQDILQTNCKPMELFVPESLELNDPNKLLSAILQLCTNILKLKEDAKKNSHPVESKELEYLSSFLTDIVKEFSNYCVRTINRITQLQSQDAAIREFTAIASAYQKKILSPPLPSPAFKTIHQKMNDIIANSIPQIKLTEDEDKKHHEVRASFEEELRKALNSSLDTILSNNYAVESEPSLATNNEPINIPITDESLLVLPVNEKIMEEYGPIIHLINSTLNKISQNLKKRDSNYSRTIKTMEDNFKSELSAKDELIEGYKTTLKHDEENINNLTNNSIQKVSPIQPNADVSELTDEKGESYADIVNALRNQLFKYQAKISKLEVYLPLIDKYFDDVNKLCDEDYLKNARFQLIEIGRRLQKLLSDNDPEPSSQENIPENERLLQEVEFHFMLTEPSRRLVEDLRHLREESVIIKKENDIIKDENERILEEVERIVPTDSKVDPAMNKLIHSLRQRHHNKNTDNDERHELEKNILVKDTTLQESSIIKEPIESVSQDEKTSSLSDDKQKLDSEAILSEKITGNFASQSLIQEALSVQKTLKELNNMMLFHSMLSARTDRYMAAYLVNFGAFFNKENAQNTINLTKAPDQKDADQKNEEIDRVLNI